MKKILIICGIIFVIISIVACGGGGSVDTSKAEKIDNADTVDTEDTEDTEEIAEDKVFKIGEAIKLNNVSLTVTGIEKSKGNEYERKQGVEFVIVSLKIKNVGKDERVSYNPYDFKIENSKGTLTSEGYMSDLETLNSGELAPGGEVSGKLVFEAPENDPKLTLEYEENMFTDDVIRVALNH